MWPKLGLFSEKPSVSQPIEHDALYRGCEEVEEKAVPQKRPRLETVFKAAVVTLISGLLMMLFHSGLKVFISAYYSDGTYPSEYRDAFDDFVIKYDKHYASPAEREYRFSIFVRNMNEWEEEEAKTGGDLDLDVTWFADRTDRELRGLLMRDYTQKIPFEGSKWEGPILPEGVARPLNVDWRRKGKVTPVKDQGQCGSCWSFATVASIESQHAIKKNESTSLSEQELIDCEEDQNGCHGGYRPYAFRFVKKNGLLKENFYPYTGREGAQCRHKNETKSRVYIDDYRMLNSDENQIADWVAQNGPLTFGMNVTKPLFSYRSGVFHPSVEDCQHKSQGSHALTIVGYGTQSGLDYWLVKNSWGTRWGENGYFKLARGHNACGMANVVVGPIIH